MIATERHVQRNIEARNPNALIAVVYRGAVPLAKGALRQLREIGYYYKVVTQRQDQDKTKIIVIGNPRRMDPAQEIITALIPNPDRGNIERTQRVQRVINRIFSGIDQQRLQKVTQPYRY